MTNLEQHIASILTKEKIDFIREYWFKDLHGGRYRYDFYLPKLNILVEVDGPHHTKQIYTRKEFMAGQERDRRKNSYALANNIPLYRIQYWDINNKKINSFSDITQDKNRVKSKFHNDYIVCPK